MCGVINRNGLCLNCAKQLNRNLFCAIPMRELALLQNDPVRNSARQESLARPRLFEWPYARCASSVGRYFR